MTVLLGLSLILLQFTVAQGCSFSPSLWCSSKEIAKKCQVELQCEKYVWTVSSDAPKVDFTLYIESLCPDCKNFIKQQLWPTWKEINQIMNLQIVPYGNAMERKRGKEWEFTCQHGTEECLGNLIETCAIYLVKNATLFFPFIHCIEVSTLMPKDSAPKCAEQFGIKYSDVLNCVTGPLGNALEHEMAEKTNALKPPHQYVPWVTLNGVHTEKIQKEAQNDLKKLICDNYKGKKPEACSSEVTYSRCLKD